MLKRLTVRQKGLHVIAESADLGIVLHWDQGTKIYLKIDPKWKNRVCYKAIFDLPILSFFFFGRLKAYAATTMVMRETISKHHPEE